MASLSSCGSIEPPCSHSFIPLFMWTFILLMRLRRHSARVYLDNVIEPQAPLTEERAFLPTRDAIPCGKLRKGDLVVFAAVGAGYTLGANLWRWHM